MNKIFTILLIYNIINSIQTQKYEQIQFETYINNQDIKYYVNTEIQEYSSYKNTNNQQQIFQNLFQNFIHVPITLQEQQNKNTKQIDIFIFQQQIQTLYLEIEPKYIQDNNFIEVINDQEIIPVIIQINFNDKTGQIFINKTKNNQISTNNNQLNNSVSTQNVIKKQKLEARSQRELESNINKNTLTLHKRISFHCWAWAIDIAIIVARFAKSFQYYIVIHEIFMWSICLLTSYFELELIYQNWNALGRDKLTDDISYIHYILGVLFMLLFIVQFVGGYILKKKLKQFNDKHKNYVIYKKFHMILGTSLYLIGKIEILTGKFASSWRKDIPLEKIYQKMIFEFLVLFSYIAIRIVLEIFHKLELKFWITTLCYFNQKYVNIYNKFINIFKKNTYAQLEESQEYSPGISQQQKQKVQIQELINMIDYRVPFEQIEQQNKIKYCIYENNIISLENFIHPGGNFMIPHMHGREIDRFIEGGYSLEQFQNIKAYEHSAYLNIIFKEKLFGKIQNIVANPIKSINQNVLDMQEEKPYKLTPKFSYRWQIQEIQDLNIKGVTNDLYLVKFSSPYYKVQNTLPGVNWFGRYYKIKLNKKNSPTRLYTQTLCMTQDNILFRQKFINIYNQYFPKNKNEKLNKIKENNKIIPQNNDKSFSSYIPFIIKKYPQSKNGLAQLIYNEKYNENCTEYNVQIRGPFGLGLQFNSQTEGKYVIIAGGTGILPFSDIFDYLLKKSIFEAFVQQKKNFQEFQQYLGQNNIDLLGLKHNFNNIQFKLFSSFKNENEYLLGENIIEPLHQINQQNNFKFFTRFVQFTQQKPNQNQKKNKKIEFNEEFFLKQDILDAKMIFVCGPPIMNQKIPLILENIGIKKNKINYL